MRDTPVTPLQLICLGPPTARLAGADPPPDVLWRKHLALLAYLALTPGHARGREHLIGLLWAEKQQDAARHSLSEALRRLRAGLGADRIVSAGDTVTLSPDSLDVDATRFEQLAGTDAERALGIYQGDFFEGFVLGDAPAFDDWATGQRARLRARATLLMIEGGERALAEGQFALASDRALRACTLEPLAERPVRLLMKARALADDSRSALAAFHEYAERLRAELKEEPGRDLHALAARLRDGGGRSAGPAAGESEVPFVGRSRDVTLAFETVASAVQGGGPRTLIVMGATGMGKSRLLSEIAKRAALDGASIAAARALAHDQGTPWSALRQVCLGLAVAPGVFGAAPDAVAVLAFFAPALAERVQPSAPRDAAHAGQAIAALIAAAADEAPVVLVVDNAQLADASSLAALHAALRALEPSAVGVALGVNDDEAAAPELLALSTDVGGAVPGTLVRIPPFTKEAMLELVRAMAPSENDENADRLTRRLMVETRGSPFWSVTLLRALRSSTVMRSDMLEWPVRTRTYDTPLPPGVPELARLAAASRLSALAERERAVLLAMAVVGGGQDPEVLAAVSGVDRSGVDAALTELERTQLVVFEGARYAFAAPLFGTVVRVACLKPGELDRLQRRAAAALHQPGPA